MSGSIPINLVFEDDLSKAVLEQLLLKSSHSYEVGNCFHGRGYGYIKKNISGFNNASKGMPFLVLIDLDAEVCAPTKIRNWLSVPKHPNLLFRIAVREVESWLLADRVGFAKFLGIRKDLIPDNIEEIKDPKKFLIELAKRSRKRALREDLVPSPGSTAKQGPVYNDRLISFVTDSWDHSAATINSPSLERTIRTLESFTPIWDQR